MPQIGDLRQTKQILNLPDTFVASDDKILGAILEADSLALSQLRTFGVTSLPNPDPDLIRLCCGLAAATVTYWNSQTKSPDLMDAINHYQKRLTNYIQSIYGGRTMDGYGSNRFAKVSSAVTGTEGT